MARRTEMVVMIDQAQLDALNALAKLRQVSRSALVRQAILVYMERIAKSERPQRDDENR